MHSMFGGTGLVREEWAVAEGGGEVGFGRRVRGVIYKDRKKTKVGEGEIGGGSG